MLRPRIRDLMVAVVSALTFLPGAGAQLSAQEDVRAAARAAGVTVVSNAGLGAQLVRRSGRIRITVLYGIHCSNSQAMFRDLGPLSRRYGPRGVEFFAYSTDDSAADVAAIPGFLREHLARVQSRWLERGRPGELGEAVGRIDVPLGSSFTLPLVILQDATGALVWSGEGVRSLRGMDAWLDEALR